MSDITKARKGDLILVERVTRNHFSVAAYTEAKAAGRTLQEIETTYEFGMVASATREGEVKTWFQLAYGDALISEGCAVPISDGTPVPMPRRCWVMSAKTVDVTGVLTAAKAHHWPGHPGQPKPFSSFDEARAVALPFRILAVSA